MTLSRTGHLCSLKHCYSYTSYSMDVIIPPETSVDVRWQVLPVSCGMWDWHLAMVPIVSSKIDQYIV